MSFRNRLTLFFVAIVIVPMLSVAIVLFTLIADNEQGKADAQLQARQELARNLYLADVETAGRLASRVGADQLLATALRRGEQAAAQRRARALLRELGLARILVTVEDGMRVDAGRPDAVAPARRELVDADGSRLGELTVSDRSGRVFARTLDRLTGMDAVIRAGDRTLAATTRVTPPARLPGVGTVKIGGDEYRVVSTTAPGFGGERLRIALLDPQSDVASHVARSRWAAAGVLGAFLLLALLCALLVSRSLQAQIGTFLAAARRLGKGDFRALVPIQGRDEFAALGGEFNQMAAELEKRQGELEAQRRRLEGAMRRLGEAFGSNLDRAALLEISVRTAVDAVDGGGGHAVLAGGEEAARSGDPGALRSLVAAVESDALRSGQPGERSADEGAAMVHPLPAAGGGLLGVVSVWREGAPFEDAERDLFHYLAGQTAVSLDNVALHETVQRQAVTDELTGLSNHRRFQEALGTEMERARRFGTGVGLVMLDIDNFKSVNDTYGHQVGDLVLAEVARVLRDQSREIDEPARYGGEELAVVLPGTDLEGAYNLAERVREGIEALEFPLDGRGTLKVTASFGAAATPETSNEQAALIAGADTALYAAKRGGKNRTVCAESERAPRAQ